MNKTVVTFLLLISAGCLFAQNSHLITYYEASGNVATPRYEETMDYTQKLQEHFDEVNCFVFGESPEQRDIYAIIVDKEGLKTPEEIKDAGRMVVMIQACIHPGESEGKDAGFLLIRDICSQPTMQPLLEHLSILFIPILNVDGHERFSPYGRINQNGPEEMGWRVTAQNLNLNRDYIKAAAPEMQAWLQLWNAWDPDFFVDLHTTDGADYQYELTYMMETQGSMDSGITQWCKETFLPPFITTMAEKGFPVFPYVQFRAWHDPRSGLTRMPSPAMLSQAYASQCNRAGLLIETHMLKPYDHRVESTYAALSYTLEKLNEEYKTVTKLNKSADALVESSTFRLQPFPLTFQLDNKDSVMVDFLGVEYEVKKSPLTGGNWYVYDNNKPVTFSLPLFQTVEVESSAMLPEAYIIPAAWTDVIACLSFHGVEMKPLTKEVTIPVTTYRLSAPKYQSGSREGRQYLYSFNLTEQEEEILFPKGSMVVQMNQKRARIIALALEPKASGSLLQWGSFNSIFEQKEYAETYVMEPIAQKMLEDDSALRQEFEALLEANPAIKNNQWELLNWFYRKTPYWDKNLGLYPVGKIMNKKVLEFVFI